MRKIPVVVNGDETHIVGYLELNDNVDDEQLRDMYVSWLWMPERKQVISVSLVPMMSILRDRLAESIPADETGRDLNPVHCIMCKGSVPYASYHARDGVTPRDVVWVCQGRAKDPGIVRHR